MRSTFIVAGLLSITGCGGGSPSKVEQPVAAAHGVPANVHTAAAPAQQPAPPTPAAPAPAQASTPKITLTDLTARRDLWPGKVALKKPFKLSGNKTLPVGKDFALDELLGTKIHLDTGTDLIECVSADTDVLERASAYMATLTPEQLALTAATLPAHSELWPLTVVMTRAFPFQNGSNVPIGREVVLRSFEGNQLKVYDRTLKTWFLCEMHETDVFTRARERMKLAEKERTPFFVRSLSAAVEPAASGTNSAGLEQAEYVLVYRAKLGCTRCAAFMPELKAFCDKEKTEHPEFQAVFLSDDKSASDAKELIEKEKLPGRVVAFDKRLEAADIEAHTGELLPLLFLYDKSGKLVAQNHPNGGSPAAADILKVVEQKLAKPAR